MIQDLLPIAAVLASAWLFGGMLLFAGGFAAFLFTALPVAEARMLIRRAFPHFYLFVIAVAAVAALLSWPVDRLSAGLLAAIAMTTVPARQWLMPAINAATDAGQKRRFARLHTASVLLTLGHIAVAGVVLARSVGG